MIKEWSDAQKSVINTIEGPVMVVACPGAGKTSVILERVNYMLQNGIDPEQILVVTYTDAAVEDMKKRFYREYRRKDVKFTTIHGLCLAIVEHAFGKNTIYRENEWEQMIEFKKMIRARVQVSDYQASSMARKMMHEISVTRNTGGALKNLDPFTRDIYKEYQQYKLNWRKPIKKKRVDYDDMLALAAQILTMDSKECSYWHQKYRYLTIDEFQDTNILQLNILAKLVEKDVNDFIATGDVQELFKSGNICVVGDDDQSVYGFRGANPRVFHDFKKMYYDHKEFKLDTNYRSRPEIVDVAAKLIAHNKQRIEKSFVSNRKKGEKDAVILMMYNQYVDMLYSMAAKMNMLYFDKDISYKQMAVLFRTNRQALPIIADLLLRNIPFRFNGDNIPDIHDEVFFQDVKTYYELTKCLTTDNLLKVLNHPNHNINCSDFEGCIPTKESFVERLSTCGRYKKEETLAVKINVIEKLFARIEELGRLSPVAFVERLYDGEYIAWLKKRAVQMNDNPEVMDVLLYYVKFEAAKYPTMSEWIESFDNYTWLLEHENEKKACVCLSTYHSSKGLEWSETFLIDVNEGVAPYISANSEAELEEERRLFYVAVTRAKECVNLYVTGQPSPYLVEMDLIKQENIESTGESEQLIESVE